MAEKRRPFRAASAGGGIAAVAWLAQALSRAARLRQQSRFYWVLKGQKRDFYICARPGCCHLCTALCVFDSEVLAREHLESLSEPQMFLDTLEFYGPSMPPWAHEELLLPRACVVSGEELQQIIEESGVPYVALNPPPASQGAKTFRLWHAKSFLAGRGHGARIQAQGDAG